MRTVNGTIQGLVAGLLLITLITLDGCVTTNPEMATAEAPTGQRIDLASTGATSADDLLVVDCRLPGQIRKLGRKMTYLSPRRAAKLPARECEIRGGEYVAYDRGNMKTALQVWLSQAQTGDPEAQVYVAEIYEKGMGAAPNYAEAAKWYEKAANQGSTRAQISLGYLYEQGLGVPADRKKALSWYRKAAGSEERLTFDVDGITTEEKQELKALRSEVRQRKQETIALRKQIDRTQGQLRQTRTKMEQKQQDLNELEQELNQSRKVFREQSQKEPPAPDEQRLNALRSELNQRETALANKEQEITSLRDQVASLQKQAINYQQELNDASQQNQEIGRLHKQIANAREQLEHLKQEMARRESEMAVDRANMERARHEWELQKSQATQAGSEKLKQMEKALSEKELQYENQQNVIEDLKTQMAKLEKDAHQYQEQLAAAGKQNQEIGRLRKQTADAHEQLEHLKQEMAKRESEMAMDRANMERARHEWELQKSQATQAGSEKLKQMEKALSEKELQYENQQNVIEDLRTQMAKLEKDAQQYQEQLSETNMAATELAGPSIEIIEPEGITTRGVRILPIGAETKALEVIGKVTAPAGLYSFAVNGTNQNVEENGMFRARLPSLKNTAEPIEVVAVDNQGKRAAVKLMIETRRGASSASSGSAVTTQAGTASAPPPIDFGPYYALIIGNDSYTLFPRLETAAADARAVEQILRSRYGFKTKLLLNATRYDILSALNGFRKKLTEKDNFLIYYAGHGELEKVNLRGYWLPIDAEPNSTANWVSNVAVTDILNTISAKQILIIADSCYSGTLTRSSIANLESGQSEEARANWLRLMAKRRARTVLTSGELNPVMDAGGGGHSVFAKALLEVLGSNADILEGRRLYLEVSARVAYDADRYGIEQVPQYGPIRHAGHEAGDFFFVPGR